MLGGTTRFEPKTAEQRLRRTLRVPQPDSTAALRPSQRRAAENRATLARRSRSIEQWVHEFRALTMTLAMQGSIDRVRRHPPVTQHRLQERCTTAGAAGARGGRRPGG